MHGQSAMLSCCPVMQDRANSLVSSPAVIYNPVLHRDGESGRGDSGAVISEPASVLRS